MLDLIQKNYNLALLNFPEIFYKNYKLFIEISFNSDNSSKYLALIDTGSTNTLISYNIVENEKLIDLIDFNYNEEIKSINNINKCKGRIWYLEFKNNDTILKSSPIIINNSSYDIILGLDFLSINNLDILLSKKILIKKDKIIKIL